MDIPEAGSWSAADFPTLRDYLVSAGFEGTAILLAAILAACVLLYAVRRAARRQERHREQDRDDRARAEAIDRCWDRFVWMVNTAGVEPAARDVDEANLGLGPELALELLQGLQRDATELGDQTLAAAVSVYLTQYALVLQQQAGPVPSSARTEADGHRAPGSGDSRPDTPAAREKQPATAPADNARERRRG